MPFESIVRPAVVPNIRPQKPQGLLAPSDPEQGLGVIRGNAASVASRSRSSSYSLSRSYHREIQRISVRKRVYQKEDDPSLGPDGRGRGPVNKNNWVDVDYAKEITWAHGAQRADRAAPGDGKPREAGPTAHDKDQPPQSGREQETKRFIPPKSKDEDPRNDNIETITENIVLTPKDFPPPLPGGTYELMSADAAKGDIKAAKQRFENLVRSRDVKATFKLKSMHGSFSTDYELQTTNLQIPTGYDLEAGDVSA